MSCAVSIAFEGFSALCQTCYLPAQTSFHTSRSDSLAVHIIDEAFIFQVDRRGGTTEEAIRCMSLAVYLWITLLAPVLDEF
jgi:hypothetical protein